MSVSATLISSNLDIADNLKAEGNAFFAAGEFKKAIGRYSKIIGYATIPSIPSMAAAISPSAPQNCPVDVRQRAKLLLLNSYGNMAAAYMSLQDYAKAKEYSLLALKLDPTHTKSRFRLTKAALLLGDLELAAEHAKVLEPLAVRGDVALHTIVSEVKQKVQAQESAVAARMAKAIRGQATGAAAARPAAKGPVGQAPVVPHAGSVAGGAAGAGVGAGVEAGAAPHAMSDSADAGVGAGIRAGPGGAPGSARSAGAGAGSGSGNGDGYAGAVGQPSPDPEDNGEGDAS